jgi:hypothetical protein
LEASAAATRPKSRTAKQQKMKKIDSKIGVGKKMTANGC